MADETGSIKVYLSLVSKQMESGLKTVAAGFGGITRQIFSLRGAFAGLGAAFTLRAMIKEATEAEAVAAKLGASFKGVGGITKEQTEELKNYAAALQKSTRFGDDQIMRAQAMLGTFNITADSAKKLTMSLLDMAEGNSLTGEGMGDLTEGAKQLGRALAGNVGALSRSGVVMSETEAHLIKTGDEAQRVATVIKVIENNFGGAASAMGKTFAGAVALTKNNFSDLLEEMGLVFTRSESIRTVIKAVGDAFSSVTDGIKADSRGMADAISDIVKIMVVGFGGATEVIARLATTMTFLQETLIRATQLKATAATAAGSGIGRARDVYGSFDDELLKIQTRYTSIEKINESIQKTTRGITKSLADARGKTNGLQFPSGGRGGASGAAGDVAKAAKEAEKATALAAFNSLKLAAEMQRAAEAGAAINRELAAASFGVLASELEKAAEVAAELETTLEEIGNLDTIRLDIANAFVGEISSAADIISGTLQAGASTFGNIMADQWLEGGQDFNEILKAMGRFLIAATVQAVALAIVLKGIKAALGGLTGGPLGFLAGLLHHGGPVMHQGGMVGKKYHGGGMKLEADEVPIIAQRGEYMINRNAMKRPGAREQAAMLNRGMPMQGNQTTIIQEGGNFSFAISGMDTKSLRQTVETEIIPMLEAAERRRLYRPGQSAA